MNNVVAPGLNRGQTRVRSSSRSALQPNNVEAQLRAEVRKNKELSKRYDVQYTVNRDLGRRVVKAEAALNYLNSGVGQLYMFQNLGGCLVGVAGGLVNAYTSYSTPAMLMSDNPFVAKFVDLAIGGILSYGIATPLLGLAMQLAKAGYDKAKVLIPQMLKRLAQGIYDNRFELWLCFFAVVIAYQERVRLGLYVQDFIDFAVDKHVAWA